jgi:hypothetical protein
MKRAQELGLANGDLNFRTYAAVCTPMLTLSAGSPLSQMKEECVEGVRVGEQEGNVDMTAQTRWRLRAIRCLQGENENLGLVTLIDLCFYRAIATCTTYARVGRGFEGLRLRLAVQSDLRKLAKWAESNEVNYASHHLLVRGEYHRVIGKREQARRDLEEARSHAERRGTHNVAALAHERLAAWHEANGTMDERRAALEAAVAAYRRWGAEACVARLSARLDAPMARV